VADAFDARRIPVYGPTRNAARLEWSKCVREGSDDAGRDPDRSRVRFDTVWTTPPGASFFWPSWVIKVGRIGGWQGVLVTRDRDGSARLRAGCLEGGRFGESGKTVLMEEHLEGDEVSIMAVCDGRGYVCWRRRVTTSGRTKGIMARTPAALGAFAPAWTAPSRIQAGRRIVLPLLTAMSRRGSPFSRHPVTPV
jgi:phosphoribosylamine--glycine ligase